MKAAATSRLSPVPGPMTPWQWFQNVLFYINIAFGTLIVGIWGLFVVALDPRDGPQKVPDVWLAHLLRAARWHLRLEVEVRGRPPEHDCIVAAKHQCFLDIIAIAEAVPRRSFIMKREVARVPIVGWFTLKAGCIPIDRTKGKDAMKMIAERIERRIAGPGLGQLIIYPEGTRTRPGERLPYKHGVATIRAATGLPVIPVAVNTGLFWPRKGWGIRPGRAVIEFLPPIEEEVRGRDLLALLAETIEGHSDRLMAEAGFPPPGMARE